MKAAFRIDKPGVYFFGMLKDYELVIESNIKKNILKSYSFIDRFTRSYWSARREAIQTARQETSSRMEQARKYLKTNSFILARIKDSDVDQIIFNYENEGDKYSVANELLKDITDILGVPLQGDIQNSMPVHQP